MIKFIDFLSYAILVLIAFVSIAAMIDLLVRTLL
mgnify:CR=1 FL=1